jgi:hypothetical protein
MPEASAPHDLSLRPAGTSDEPLAVLPENANPQFLHAVLCQLGLPRNPTSQLTFERTSGRASLLLQAGKSFDGMKWVPQPLPSGTRPRLVLINLCSEAVRTRSASVDIGGSVREFLRCLNIDCGGKNMAQFRRQMLALSSCHMTLAMATATGTKQISAQPIDAFQAWHTNDDGQQTLWPGFIRLTDKFFDSLMEHAVPLQPEAIGQLQNSALALDVYSWLAHRLCRVNEPEGVLLSWAALKGQFGAEYSDTKNFKRKFLGALQKATRAYPEARIEPVAGGLRLKPSAPPVKRSAIAVRRQTASRAAEDAALAPPAAVPARALTMQDLVSEAALEQLRAIAPGWDRYGLAATYVAYVNDELGGERPRNGDAAFLGWAKKFTKGRPA